MSTTLRQHAIEQTQAWIDKVVIGCGFCPFAKAVFQNSAIRYQVTNSTDMQECLHLVIDECRYLDDHELLETGFVIFTSAFSDFASYLDCVNKAESLLKEQGYVGIYQLASFHPDYRFARHSADDPANYTNRSPFPMLHILRELSLEKALQTFPEPDSIPERNITLAREKGKDEMKEMLDQCRNIAKKP